MIILFHSEECKFCIKLLEYINTNNLTDFFKFINIDTLATIPENITIVPTVIDSSIEAPLEGKKAFEYVVNHKYFNHPTNNVDYWVNKPPPKPTIEEDKKALDKSLLTIYTNLDDDKQQVNQQNKTKQVYYKPVTKAPIISKKPIIAKKPIMTKTNQTSNQTFNQISNQTSNLASNLVTNQTEINNFKKNIALLKLRR
jgi:hypothetical protein